MKNWLFWWGVAMLALGCVNIACFHHNLASIAIGVVAILLALQSFRELMKP